MTADSGGPSGYRASHLGADKARSYDEDFWAERSAKGLAWQLERRLLDASFDRHMNPAPKRAIDFACGTGRVLSYLEGRVPQTTGIDVSDDMLAIARERCRGSTLLSCDVTSDPPGGFDGQVDLVTAFRFFLNAEPELRRDALQWIRGVLSPSGVLVANFHLNPRSLRGSYLRVRSRDSGSLPMMGPDHARTLLARNGFDLMATYGYDFLPFRREGTRLIAPASRRWIEHALIDRPALSGWGGSFLLVARAT